MSVRLHIIVEGQTEEAFVNQVLAPALGASGFAIAARSVETSRRRTQVFRGGLVSYQKLKGDLERWMRQDRHPDVWFTTMIDLYGLDRVEFPSFGASQSEPDPYRRVALLEEAFRQDINHPRFIPYIQLHEFEALLLSDPQQFDWEFIEHRAAIDRLARMAATFESPEHINDGSETAPSKRIIREIPDYKGRKPSAGPVIAAKIGLPTLREKCRHFSGWIGHLEALAPALP